MPAQPESGRTAAPADQFEATLLQTAKGGSIVLGGKLYMTAARVVIGLLLARILLPEQYGSYNVAISTAMISASVALLGLDSAVLRYVALSTSREDTPGTWGILQVSLLLCAATSTLSTVAMFAASYPLAALLHAPGLVPLLQLACVIVPFAALSDVLVGATRGFKRMQDGVIAESVLQPTVRLILLIGAAVLGLSAFDAVLIYAVGVASTFALLLYFLHRRFPLTRPIGTARREVRPIIGYAIPVWLSDLMVRFRENVQTLLVGSLASLAGVGIFAVANQVSLLANMFHGSLAASAKPLIVELHERGDYAQLGQLYRTTTKWAVAVILPSFVVMILLPQPILAVFGEAYVAGASTLQILAVASLVMVGTGMCGTILDMAGYAKLKLANAFVRLVLAIALNLILVPRLGIVGAALAILLGELTINLLRLLQVAFLFRIWAYDRTFLKPVSAAAAAAVVGAITGQLIPPGSDPLRGALHALVIVAVYVTMLPALGLSAEEMLVLRRIRARAFSAARRFTRA
jgi:O-antigen/teichoic acid export membrane protein